jgi:hypothetical protein
MVQRILRTLDDFIVPSTSISYDLNNVQIPRSFGTNVPDDSLRVEFSLNKEKYMLSLHRLLSNFKSDSGKMYLELISSRVNNVIDFMLMHKRLSSLLAATFKTGFVYRGASTTEIEGHRTILGGFDQEYDEDMVMTTNTSRGMSKETALGIFESVLKQASEGKGISVTVPTKQSEILQEKPMLDVNNDFFYAVYLLPQNPRDIYLAATMIANLLKTRFAAKDEEALDIEEVKFDIGLPLRKYREVAHYPRQWPLFPDLAIKERLMLPGTYEDLEERDPFIEQACQLQKANFDFQGDGSKIGAVRKQLCALIHDITSNYDFIDDKNRKKYEKVIHDANNLLRKVKSMKVICYREDDCWPAEMPLEVSEQFFGWPRIDGGLIKAHKSMQERDYNPFPDGEFKAFKNDFKRYVKERDKRENMVMNVTFVRNIYAITDLELV